MKPAMPIPPSQIDPTTFPPGIHTSDPDSFAYNTFKVRVPKIIDDVVAANTFSAPVEEAITNLRAEITVGQVCGLHEETPDRAFWEAASQDYIGHTWLNVPWFWAETYFYRRMLEATGYFQPGPGYGVDPYAAIKAQELTPKAAPALLNMVLETLHADPANRFQQLLYASLWGNRIDLSYNVAGHMSQSGHMLTDTANLLVDDSRATWASLQAQSPGHLALIADNAGTEFFMDLALIDFLLDQNLATQLDLYLKPQPFFISDAMPQDLEIGLVALKQGGSAVVALQRRLSDYLSAGRLHVHTHWYFPTSLFYYQLPDDLYRQLAETNLVIIKGDANYRRLLGDAHWPPTTPFSNITTYFPAPVVALRTLKSEIIVGLTAAEFSRLQAEDPDWQVNGRRGMIQYRGMKADK